MELVDLMHCFLPPRLRRIRCRLQIAPRNFELGAGFFPFGVVRPRMFISVHLNMKAGIFEKRSYFQRIERS